MRVLGIDPALSITGYGIIDLNGMRLSLVEAGIIKTGSSELVTERLKKIYGAVSLLISGHKPDVVVLEKLFAHYRHPTTAFLLGQARGVICLACAMADLPLIEYSATRVKKAVIGKGLATKAQVQRMIVSVLRIKDIPKYNDVSDALALAIAHSSIIKSVL
jgi:crossover junction endodeoxyribonuclease RuvC